MQAAGCGDAIQLVPLIYEGPVSRPLLRRLLDTPSRFRIPASDGGDGQRQKEAAGGGRSEKLATHFVEGLYLRVDEGPYLKYRAKLVRPDFIQHINEGGTHWTRQSARQNRVLHGAAYDYDPEEGRMMSPLPPC